MRGKLTAVTLALALAVPVAPLSAAPAADTSPLSCGLDEVRFRTFWVEMEPPAKKTYRPGEKVVLTITVTRPAHEDPFGLEQPVDPPQAFPAEGVPVNAGVAVGYYYQYGNGAITDSAGVGRVTIKLPRYFGAGSADVDVLAKIKQADSPCYDVVEEGYRYFDDAFGVRR